MINFNFSDLIVIPVNLIIYLLSSHIVDNIENKNKKHAIAFFFGAISVYVWLVFGLVK